MQGWARKWVTQLAISLFAFVCPAVQMNETHRQGPFKSPYSVGFILNVG